MSYLLDAVLVILFAVCVWIGWKRGFIKTVSGLIALVLAVIVASTFSAPIAQAVYTDSVEPAVMATLEEQINNEVLPSAEELDTAIEKMPALVVTLLETKGIGNGEAILAQVEGVDAGKSAARTITDRVIAPIVLPLMQMLCSIVLFVVAYVIAAILLRVLDLVAKLPLLTQLNRVLGVVAGALTGAVWVVFVARFLFTVAWLGMAEWLTPAVMEQTWIASLANGLIPTIEV